MGSRNVRKNVSFVILYWAQKLCITSKLRFLVKKNSKIEPQCLSKFKKYVCLFCGSQVHNVLYLTPDGEVFFYVSTWDLFFLFTLLRQVLASTLCNTCAQKCELKEPIWCEHPTFHFLEILIKGDELIFSIQMSNSLSRRVILIFTLHKFLVQWFPKFPKKNQFFNKTNFPVFFFQCIFRFLENCAISGCQSLQYFFTARGVIFSIFIFFRKVSGP